MRKEPKNGHFREAHAQHLHLFFIFSVLPTGESFGKMHFIYCKGHSNKGFGSIAISMLGQALKLQSSQCVIFFLTSSETAVNGNYQCSRLRMKRSRHFLLHALRCTKIGFSRFSIKNQLQCLTYKNGLWRKWDRSLQSTVLQIIWDK